MKLKNILPVMLCCFSLFTHAQQSGKVVQAKTVYTTKSTKAQEYYNQALDNFDKQNFRRAVELNKLAIAQDTNFIDAYDNLGLAYRKLNMLDSAEYYYVYSFKKDSTNVAPIQNLAVIAEIGNNFEKAKMLYLLITAMEPEDPEGYFGLARMQYLLEQKDEALKSGQLAEKYYKQINSPYIGDCYYILCIICLDLKNIELARKYMKLSKQAGIEIDPKLEAALK